MVAGAASPRVPELQVKYFNFITNIFSALAKRTKNKVPHANQMGKYNKSNLNMILSSQTQSRRSRISHLEVSVVGGGEGEDFFWFCSFLFQFLYNFGTNQLAPQAKNEAASNKHTRNK